MPRQIRATIRRQRHGSLPKSNGCSSSTNRKRRHRRRHRSVEEKQIPSNKDVPIIHPRSSGNESHTILSPSLDVHQHIEAKRDRAPNLQRKTIHSDQLKSSARQVQSTETARTDREASRTLSKTSTRSPTKSSTDSHEVMYDAWSDRSMSSPDRVWNKKTERRSRRRRICCGWSCPCLLLSLLAAFCLAAIIAAILLALFTAKKVNLTTTVSSTTASTTSTTSQTSSTTSTTSVSSSTTSTTTTSETTSTSSSTTFTSTTTVTTETTSVTTSTVTTTTQSTTTTTTLPVCNSPCGNDTTVSSVPFFARWNFENNFEDSMLTYNATSINGPTFVLGYIGQAVALSAASDQYLSASYIPINSKSFTVDAWIYPTSYPNTKGIHSIVGLCPQQVVQECFQFGLRSNVTSTSSTGYFGLWEAADLRGTAPMRVNEWTHVAIVYSKSKSRQSLFVDGNFDNSRASSNGFTATSGTFYIGDNDALTGNPSFGPNNFQGYIDQLTVSNGIRSSCEILNVATMACRFPFDDPTEFLADAGPNNVVATAFNYVSTTGLKGTQAISFSGMPPSYLQASGFRFLSYNNAPFSLSLWVQPTLRQGVLVGSSLGYNPLTFASNGSLIARVASASVSYDVLLQLTPIWSHIVLTWSASNGLLLYVNNQLVRNAPLATVTGSGASSNNFTLGGGTFDGVVDEWRIYSRELTADDVCAIFTN